MCVFRSSPFYLYIYIFFFLVGGTRFSFGRIQIRIGIGWDSFPAAVRFHFCPAESFGKWLVAPASAYSESFPHVTRAAFYFLNYR